MLHTVTNRTSYRKAFLVAHSLGNLQILHCIQRVFGLETTSKIKALVSIAAPWAGAPKAARVLVSGDEMLARQILSDADIRDFGRKLSAVYMLMPDETLWANVSTLMRFWGGDAQLGVTSLPGRGGVAAANLINSRAEQIAGRTANGGRAGGSGDRRWSERGAEMYRMTRRDIRALLGKLEAHSPGAHGMQEIWDQVAGDRIVDIWKAPPIPVVCIAGAGSETHIEYGYREPWPRNMDEEPCPIRSEDGDSTVPLRSVESVCNLWQRQKRCRAPLSAASLGVYKAKTDECVETVVMHCKAANMESADIPRGADHCYFLHARILHKQPVLDLVQAIAVNPQAFEPGFTPSLDQLYELIQLVTWLHNSAVRRLPTLEDLEARLTAQLMHPDDGTFGQGSSGTASGRNGGAPSGARAIQHGAGSGSSFAVGGGTATIYQQTQQANPEAAASRAAEGIRQAVFVLRSRPAFEHLLGALKTLGAAAKGRVRAAAAAAETTSGSGSGSDASGTTEAGVAAAEQEVASALESARVAIGAIASASRTLGTALEAVATECSTRLEPGTRRRSTQDGFGRRGGAQTRSHDEDGDGDGVCAVGGGGLAADACVGSTGLPDFDWSSFEAASHSSLRASKDSHREERKVAAEKRRAMCRLRDAIQTLDPDLQDLKSQVEYVELHWASLVERLQRPEPPPAKKPPGDAGAREGAPPVDGGESYVSALYDDLGSEADDVSRH